MTALRDWLLSRNPRACSEAVEWVGDRDLPTAWAECERGDWLLWLAEHAGVDRRTLTLAACEVARTAIPYAGEHAATCEGVIAAAESWAMGEATDEERDAARAAAWDAAGDAAGAAAWAAAWAARSAGDVAMAAAVTAARAARAGAAGDAAHREHARIVREIVPCPEVLP